jgi:hypothetical protein
MSHMVVVSKQYILHNKYNLSLHWIVHFVSFSCFHSTFPWPTAIFDTQKADPAPLASQSEQE